ncbi:multicopper oxidase family protein [Salinarimonas ramus]|uniref:L-ascorbate oxidase n=1 Tax=Salinarimonas ramus TaxID=690164 RepID=A0A917QDP4_9HYPH|nr:multicopper oxidase domain-containing protein [Salinarimonas ramus]GGK45752.1 L-ascorbate oxidase [Salinarimonas ramus]
MRHRTFSPAAVSAAALAAAMAASVLAASGAAAQAPEQLAPERLVPEIPDARIQRAAPPPDAIRPFLLAAPAPSPRVAPGEAALDLAIRYVDGTIWDPAEGRDDAARLRAYVDLNAPADVANVAPYVGPTIQVAPGETVRVTLHNELPVPDQSCPEDITDINIPHCFNRTNLHSHGLWVSPTGNSDNVLIAIDPGVSFQYEWNIPADHPSGTFWYHPHLHGGVALQVSSGMAGFIVIRGDRLPTPETNGDIDTLLMRADGQPFTERLVLLQQNQYACYDAQGNLETNPDGTYRCDPGQAGVIESYDNFSPGDWAASGRYTSINGEILPTFPGAETGRVERWRIAHAGIRDTIKLEFRKAADDYQPLDTVADAETDEDWLAANCPGEPLTTFAMAEDGLTRARIQPRTESVLQPGYRTDLLVVFPEAGSYCVIDAAAPASTTVSGGAESRQLMGAVEVAPGADAVPADPTGLTAYLTAALVAAANRTMPADVRETVAADLLAGLRLDKFVPHPTIEASEVTGTQSLAFSIDTTTSPTGFLIDGQAYEPDRVDRLLTLGGVDEWTLTSGTNPAAGHPFHIHVNPFQVVEILNPDGVDVSVAGEPDDTQYAGMKGVWKDTLFVKPGYRVVMRTRYQRYIGEFVLHCHILDHEDQGMMQNVMIALPNASGQAMTGGHGAH